MYSDVTYFASYYFPVLTAMFFLIKLIGGESRDRKHSFVLCCLCVLYFITPDIKDNLSEELYTAEFVKALWIEILISGAGMMAMFGIAIYDKSAFKHALILALIIFISFMLSWNYTVVSSPLWAKWLTQFFKEYYDELIISVSILQIMASLNGISESISRIFEFFRSAQRRVVWGIVSCIRFLGMLQVRAKSEKRT